MSGFENQPASEPTAGEWQQRPELRHSVVLQSKWTYDWARSSNLTTFMTALSADLDSYKISALPHKLRPNMDAVLTAQYMRLTRKLYQMILGIGSGLFMLCSM